MALPLVFANPMGMLFIGVAMLLLFWASYHILARPLMELARHIPVIGADIAKGIGGAVEAVVGWVAQWVKSGIDAVVEIVSVPVRAVSNFVNWTSEAIAATATAVRTVAREAGLEIGRVASRIAGVRDLALDALDKARQTVVQLTDLRNWVKLIERTVIPGAVAAVLSQAQAIARNLFDTERSARIEAVQGARAQAERLHDLAQTARRTGDQDLARQLAAEAAALYAAVAAAQAAGRTYSDAQRRALEAQVAKVTDVVIPAALATALAATNVVAQNLARTQARCIDPLCGAFGSSVDLWNALATGAQLALVIALVASAVNDPEGTARDTAGGIGGAVGLSRDVLGAFGVAV